MKTRRFDSCYINELKLADISEKALKMIFQRCPILKQSNLPPKAQLLIKNSDLRSKAQIRVTKKIKSIGRKNVQQIQKIRIHRRLYVPQSNGR